MEPEIMDMNQTGEPEATPVAKRSAGAAIGRILGRIAIVLLETVLILVIALYGVMFVLAKGPSPTARNLFVMSVRETSAIGFLADLFFTEEEIREIESGNQIVEEYQETDTSLITITRPEDNPAEDAQQGPVPDQWGLVDEDGDGIIIDEVKGEGYSGYMMVVLDPSRVIVGTVPEMYEVSGFTVEEMVKEFGAVAGINAGGFEDPNGNGDGSIPNTLVVYDGVIHYGFKGSQRGFVGLDNNYVLHVGELSARQVEAKRIQYGVCFGPVLLSNGVPAIPDSMTGGLNPRTAIGQREDGAILMLVIDGRQAISIGATYQDLINVFLEYGAVNACNLDGGSSSMMWYQDGYVNNCASVIGIRKIPTTFLVLEEGVNTDEQN